MSTPETQNSLSAVVRTSQIIVGALAAGPLLFLAIAAFIGPLFGQHAAGAATANAPPDSFALIMNSVALAFGLMAVPMSFIVPGLVSANGRKAAIKQGVSPRTAGTSGKAAKLQTLDEVQALLLPQFPAQLIVGAAILEGAAFLAGIVTLLIGGLIAPGIAIVILVVLAARFPTESRAQTWLEQQREKLRDKEFAASASP